MIIAIEQGSDWERQYPILDPVTGVPIADFAGWSARGQVRVAYGSSAPEYEWSVAAGNLALAAGKLTIRVPAADSSGWAWVKGVYDIELTDPSGAPGRVDSGTVLVELEVTR